MISIPRPVHLAGITASIIIAASLVVPAIRNSLDRSTHGDGLYALSFSVPPGPPVAMSIVMHPIRYQLNTPDGVSEFEKLLPSGGHVVYVDEYDRDKRFLRTEPQPYTVTLFHQLKCLAILRAHIFPQYSNQTPALVGHCINYLRQTLLCRLNLGMETTTKGGGTVVEVHDAVCQDWTSVYDEAERNHKEYIRWLRDSDSVART